MELVYLWVEEYKNIKNQGFNFSPRFTCNYENGELTIEENKDYVSIFPPNINITAIVGENGSGKSNLLEYIIQNLLHHVQSKLITIVFNSKKKNLIVEAYNLENFTVVNNTIFQDIVQNYQTKESKQTIQYESFHALADYELIYYSISPFDRCYMHQKFHKFNYLGILNENGEFKVRDILIKQIKSFISLSNNEIIKGIISSLHLAIPDKILFNPIDYFYLDEKIGERIADFFEFPDSKQKTKFARKLSIQHNKARREMANFSKSSYHPHHIMSDEHEREQSLNMEKMKDFLYIHFFIETVKINLSNSLSNIVYQEQITSFVNQYQKQDDLILAIKSYFSKSIIDNAEVHPNKSIHKLIEKICQISTVIINSFPYEKQTIHNHFVIELNSIDNDFIALFEQTNMLDTFELSWLNGNIHVRLSSGEIAMIDMLFNITRSIQKTIQNHKSKFLLMIDEIELFLHPKWQKEYMNNIIKALENILKNKKCHIILTSHSPFILSDIPKNHVKFIGSKVIQEQTFGANIHTLLSHAFFMDGGLMGEFAKEKIQSIIKYHKEIEYKKLLKDENKQLREKEKEKYLQDFQKNFWNIYSIIGDDFIKQVIKNHLIEIEKILLGIDEAKQEEIERLKAHIALLES